MCIYIVTKKIWVGGPCWKRAMKIDLFWTVCAADSSVLWFPSCTGISCPVVVTCQTTSCFMGHMNLCRLISHVPSHRNTAQAWISGAARRPTSSLHQHCREEIVCLFFTREKKAVETCLFPINGFSQHLRCSLEVLRLKGQQSQVLFSCSLGFCISQCAYANVPHLLP